MRVIVTLHELNNPALKFVFRKRGLEVNLAGGLSNLVLRSPLYEDEEGSERNLT